MNAFKSLAAKTAANQTDLAQRLGRFQTLEIDPHHKRIVASIMLHGEAEALHFSGTYEFVSAAESSHLKLVSGQLSKPWMHEVLQLALQKEGGLYWPIPQKYSFILKFII